MFIFVYTHIYIQFQSANIPVKYILLKFYDVKKKGRREAELRIEDIKSFNVIVNVSM